MVSDEQARLIAEASAPIVLVDVRGRELGKLEPVDAKSSSEPCISDEELAELKRRMAAARRGEGGFVTTEQLLQNLRALAPE